MTMAMAREGRPVKRTIAGLMTAAVLTAAALVARSGGAEPFAQTVQVTKVEAGYTVGQPGLHARLTLSTGQAIDYEPADRQEAEQFLRLVELHVRGAEMFAAVDGRTVRRVHVATSSYRTAR